MFLVVVDAFSKWVDIYPTTAATTLVTLDRLRSCFATWGLPRVLCSDNAACFTCPAFEQFCVANGIEHVTSPPLSPKSNGLAERYVQSFKHKYRCSQGSVSARVAEFLFMYRNTPHSTTGRTPAELFLGRPMRHHLDLLRPDLPQAVETRQRRQKGYADRRAQNRDIAVGDAVWVSAVDRLRGGEDKHWLPGTVLDVVSVKVTVQLSDGRVVCRHRDQVRRREGLAVSSERSAGAAVDPVEPAVPLPGEAIVAASPPVIPPSLGSPGGVTPPAVPLSPGAGHPPVPAATKEASVHESGDNTSTTSVPAQGHGYNLRPRQGGAVPHRYR